MALVGRERLPAANRFLDSEILCFTLPADVLVQRFNQSPAVNHQRLARHLALTVKGYDWGG
jgi:hypothetical protein